MNLKNITQILMHIMPKNKEMICLFSALKDLNLSNFNTTKNMPGMF